MRFFGQDPGPLTGAPQVRRMKVYSARSGYVYHYYYLGRREAAGSHAPGTEFVFDVSADRKSFRQLAVVIPAGSLEPWETASGRTLAANEIYAVAKIALFQAFDERPGPALMATPVHVRAADANSILEELGI